MNALSRVGGPIVQWALHPFGQSNNLFIRIANLAIPLFALGSVVAAAYYSFSGKKLDTQLKPMTEIPSVGQAAIAFAQNLLRTNPDVKPSQFSTAADNTHQPVDPNIAKLTKLFHNESTRFRAIAKTLEKTLDEDNRFNNSDFLTAADNVIKLAYAIGVLTLQDLDASVEKLKTANITRTKADALAIQDSYQYRTYYFLTTAYHRFRSNDSSNPAPAHAALFYQPGTKQHEWNQLYNDFCDRVRMYVTEADLQRADNRHYKWTIKDTGVRTFDHEPTTVPS